MLQRGSRDAPAGAAVRRVVGRTVSPSFWYPASLHRIQNSCTVLSCLVTEKEREMVKGWMGKRANGLRAPVPRAAPHVAADAAAGLLSLCVYDGPYGLHVFSPILVISAFPVSYKFP